MRLAVHGRDASFYHVGGSRSFFDRAECERNRGRVSPSLIEILSLTKDACGGADATEGELVEVRPRDRGLAAGNAVWFLNERSCIAAAALDSP